MQERHSDRKKYFNEQAQTTEKYVIPFIEEVIKIGPETSVLEIGCGEGGNLMAFLEKGCKQLTGVDILPNKIKNAEAFYADHPLGDKISFHAMDIYDANELGSFDLIFMRDVLEHIHDQRHFMRHVKRFLKPGGKLFLGFPPWQNPFGGHQQVCENNLLSKLPYFHLLPGRLYPWTLKAFGESEAKVEGLMEIKDTGITIERFQRILRKEGYRIDKRVFYLVNPNYEVKFGLKTRVAHPPLTGMNWLRNFFITTNYYLVSVPH